MILVLPFVGRSKKNEPHYTLQYPISNYTQQSIPECVSSVCSNEKTSEVAKSYEDGEECIECVQINTLGKINLKNIVFMISLFIMTFCSLKELFLIIVCLHYISILFIIQRVGQTFWIRHFWMRNATLRRSYETILISLIVRIF